MSGEWQFQPYIRAGIAYNDNLFLDAPATERSDVIYQLSPGFHLERQGKHSELNLDYELQSISFKDNTDANGVYHQLDANGTTAIVPDLFYFDAGAMYTQRSVTPELTVPLDNLSVTGNQDDVAILQLSPYMTRQFGHDLRSDVRYRYDSVNYDRNDLPDSTSHTALANIGSVPGQQLLGWTLALQQRDTESDDGTDWKYQRAALDLQLFYSQTIVYTLSGGYERNEIQHNNFVDEGSFWLAGLIWNPNRRISITVNGGRRFYGTTGGLNLAYRSQRWTWAVDYSEDFQTSATLLTSGEADDPVIVQGDPGISAGVFLSKDLELTAVRQAGKTTLNLSLYRTDREYQELRQEEEVRGASGTWEWRLTRRSNLGVTLSADQYTYRGSAREDELYINRLYFNHRLSRNDTIEASYRNAQRNSNLPGGDYTQNLFLVTYQYDF